MAIDDHLRRLRRVPPESGIEGLDVTTEVSSHIGEAVDSDQPNGLGGLLARLRAEILLPLDRLSRLRQVVLVINLVLVAFLLQFANSGSFGTPVISVITGAAVWLAWRWIRVVRGYDQTIYWDLTEGLAFGLVGIGLVSPLDPAGLLYLFLLYGVLTFHALSLDAHRIFTRALVYLLAYAAVFLFMLDGIPDDQMARIGLLPIPGFIFLVVLGSLTARAFVNQNALEATNRQLDRASSTLGSAPDSEHIARAVLESAEELLPASTLSICLLHCCDDETHIVQSSEPLAALKDAPLSLDRIPHEQRSQLASGHVISVDHMNADWFFQAIDRDAGEGFLYAMPIRNAGALTGLLVTSPTRPLRELEVGALETLGRHASLAIERVQGMRNLLWREQSYRSLVTHSLDAMLVIDLDMIIQYETPAFTEMRGGADDQSNLNLADLFHPGDVPSVTAALTALVDETDAVEIFECRIRDAAGSWKTTEVRASNRLDDPAVGGVVLSVRDVSKRKEAESRLKRQALRDPLTELPNRSHFLAQLNDAVGPSARQPERVAVLFLDLDRFKVVNDSLGHDAGDRLLQATAERLRECVRPDDIVARFGGDEFAILMKRQSTEDLAIRIARRIITVLQAPVTIGGQEIYTSTSVGIALAEAGSLEPEELLHRADAAMYDAKREGKGRFRIFEPSMVADALVNLRLETELHQAIDQSLLEIYYQPLISLKTGEVEELEALVRWPHPEHGLLLPGSFVPLAEESGQMIPLGRWVFEEVCRQLQEQIRRTDGSASIPPVSVNLSPLQFQQPRLADNIARVLDKWSIPPTLVKFEITESAMMRDEIQAIETMQQLRQAGVKIAIDDFGVGYSSLSALRRFPIDSLKIDRSFVAGLGHDRGDTAIIQAMITYGKTVGIKVVAEGIETEDQLQYLRRFGCDIGQGNYLAKPMRSLSAPRPLRVSTPPADLCERAGLKDSDSRSAAASGGGV